MTEGANNDKGEGAEGYRGQELFHTARQVAHPQVRPPKTSKVTCSVLPVFVGLRERGSEGPCTHYCAAQYIAA